MFSSRSSMMWLSRQLTPLLKVYLSLQKLTAWFTQTSADRGRERYRRAGLTASTSYVAKGLTVLTGFVSVPLTVHYLGAERYGVWLTISSLLLWVALTDFGLAGYALVNVVSEAVGNDDLASARHYAASAFWALVAIALVRGRIPFRPVASSFPRIGCHLYAGIGISLRFSADVVCNQRTVKPAALAL